MADPATSPQTVLPADNATLTYRDGRSIIHTVKKVDLNVGREEFVGILGPSDLGKTSLLYVLSGIRLPPRTKA